MKKFLYAFSLCFSTLTFQAQTFHVSHFELKNPAVKKIVETEYTSFNKPSARQNTFSFDDKGYVTQEIFEFSRGNKPTVTHYMYGENYSELTKQLMDQYGEPVKFFGKSGPYKIYDTKIGLLYDFPTVEKNTKGEVTKLIHEKKGIEKRIETKQNKLTYCFTTENGINKPAQVFDKNQTLLGTVQFNRPESYYSYENNVPVAYSYLISKLAFKYVYKFDQAGNWIKKLTFSAVPSKNYQWELIAINTRMITYTDGKFNTKQNEVLNTLDVTNIKPTINEYAAKHTPKDVINRDYFTKREAEFAKLLE
ncbi:hypothetical protein [Aequorivita echinoideorum]|uniref:GLPGLI family protein n=1 Tax=Aequorivita echinoideorum TaxID=1549647 RepID=A0ABS5S4P1_9FLAO|nr:hypothetical protein [Aequorivita echinoideorum]MBT0606820.1 hypothetical protein [Aequorivita echinoideorum]